MSEQVLDDYSYSTSFESIDDLDQTEIIQSVDESLEKSNSNAEIVEEHCPIDFEIKKKQNKDHEINEIEIDKFTNENEERECKEEHLHERSLDFSWLFRKYTDEWYVHNYAYPPPPLENHHLAFDPNSTLNNEYPLIRNNNIHYDKNMRQKQPNETRTINKRLRDERIVQEDKQSRTGIFMFGDERRKLNHQRRLRSIQDDHASTLKSKIMNTINEISTIKNKYIQLGSLFEETEEAIRTELQSIRNYLEHKMIQSDFLSVSSQMDLKGLLQHRMDLIQNIHKWTQRRDILQDAIHKANEYWMKEKLLRYNIIPSVHLEEKEFTVPVRSEKDYEAMNVKHRLLDEEINRLSLSKNDRNVDIVDEEHCSDL